MNSLTRSNHKYLGAFFLFLNLVTPASGHVSTKDTTPLVTPQATHLIPLNSGLEYQIYRGHWNHLPNFSLLTPTETGRTPEIQLTHRFDEDFATVFEGFLKILADDTYRFRLTSDDGSRLFLNQRRILDVHSVDPREVSLSLKSGWNRIRIEHYQSSGNSELLLEYARGNEEPQQIPPQLLGTTNQSPLTPLLDAGPDQEFYLPEDRSYQLQAIVEPIEDSLQFEWSQISGPPVILDGVSNATLQIKDLKAGSYRFQVQVKTPQGASTSDSVHLNVLANALPIVDAGEDQVSRPTDGKVWEFTLKGKVTDSDGEIDSSLWELIDSPPGASYFIFSPNELETKVYVLSHGNYVFRLTATDNHGATGFDSIRLKARKKSSETPVN